MWFLTISIFRSSAKSPSTLPSTPMATSIFSASTVALPLGVSTSTVTPLSVFTTRPVREPVWIARPRLVRLWCSEAEISSSSPGRMRSSNSTTVTFVPMAL